MVYKEDRLFIALGHLIMILMTLATILPIILMGISSFTDNGTLIRNGYSFIPEQLSLFAYQWLFDTNGQTILRAYGISFLLTACGVVLSLTVTTPLAFGLSYRGLPLRGLLTFYVFFTMLFNGGLVPTYMNYTNVFGLKDTFFGLLIPSLVTNGFNVLLMKSYFTSSVPSEILEAATIDGAGDVRIMLTIAIPMAKPIIATIAMFVGIAYWNDWNNGFIYLVRRTDLFSIQNLLNRLMQNIQLLTTSASNLGSNASVGLAQIPTTTVRMAMAVLGVLPIVAVYPFVQKNFVKGITLGGVKG
jgi:putative aldouronate transport system permease protein